MQTSFPWPDIAGFDPQETPDAVALANAIALYGHTAAAHAAVREWRASVEANRQKWAAVVDAATDESSAFHIAGQDCTPLIRNLATGVLTASGRDSLQETGKVFVRSAGEQIHSRFGIAGLHAAISLVPKSLQSDVEWIWDGIGEWKV